MGFNLTCLKSGWAPVALALVVAHPAAAQHSLFLPGQPIVFSSSESNVVTSGMPSLTPKPPGSLDLENMVQAPSTYNFEPMPESAPLPSPVPLVSPAEAAQLQNQLDRRNNWILLTPAEILGTATPEKILGIADRDAFGQPRNLTAMERYAERREQSLETRTNQFQSVRASPWDFSGNQYGMSNSIYGPGDRPGMLANLPFNSPLARRFDNSDWSKLFAQPTPLPAPGPSPEQQEDMDRFRQLLNPVSPALTPAADGIKTTLPQTLLGSGQSPLTPAQPPGMTFSPLTSGIGKPAELPKLPGMWSLSYTSTPPAAAWAAQPAPWLSPAPQPFVAPQRKF